MDCCRRHILGGIGALAATGALGMTGSRLLARDAGQHSVTFTPASRLNPQDRARHERFMRKAFDLALNGSGGPFATVIVHRETGRVICHGLNANRGANRIRHGEIVAIENCATQEPNVLWAETSLYTTAEPCPMCASAMAWCRIPEVVYGTSVDTLTQLGLNQIRLDAPTIAAAAPFYSVNYVGGVLAEKTDAMYRDWIAKRKR